MSNIITTLSAYEPQVRELMPANADTMRFMRIFQNMAKLNLAECDARSVVIAMLDAASLNLDPTPALGQIYFIPYNTKSGKKQLQTMIGYRGFIALALRCPDIQSVNGHVVYSNDQFNFEAGLEPKLYHKPLLQGDRGKRCAAYAIATYKNGYKEFFLASEADIAKAKRSSKTASRPDSPWNNEDFADWMWIKTAFRRLAKFLPLTTDFQRALAIDETDVIPGMTREAIGIDYQDLPESQTEDEQITDITMQTIIDGMQAAHDIADLNKIWSEVPKHLQKDQELIKCYKATKETFAI